MGAKPAPPPPADPSRANTGPLRAVAEHVQSMALLITRSYQSPEMILACLAMVARYTLRGELDPRIAYAISNICTTAIRALEVKGTTTQRASLIVHLKEVGPKVGTMSHAAKPGPRTAEAALAGAGKANRIEEPRKLAEAPASPPRNMRQLEQTLRIDNLNASQLSALLTRMDDENIDVSTALEAPGSADTDAKRLDVMVDRAVGPGIDAPLLDDVLAADEAGKDPAEAPPPPGGVSPKTEGTD